MKALLLLFLLILYPLNSFAEIDERKTDVYFANGIKTNEGNATANTRLLREEIISVIYSGNLHTFDKKIGKVTEAYNNTHGMGFDVIESLDQKLNVVKWKDWLAGLVGYVTSHASDLKKQIDAYKASIDNGHGVLVVAHSQGNLFTKEAYDALDPCMQKQFEAVSIASPMHADIKEETPRINWDNDVVPWLSLTGSTITNSVRQIAWRDTSYDPLNHEEGTSAKKGPKINAYTKSENISKMYQGVLKANEGGYNSEVHAFTFYMGGKLWSGALPQAYVDPFSGKHLVDKKAKGEIMSAITEKLKKLQASAPADADIDIRLSWQSSDIQLQLDSKLGDEDKNPVCGFRRYYRKSADGVAEGTYAVHVNHSGVVDEDSLPQNVSLSIKTPTAAMTIDVEVKTESLLNLGHVADIVVTEHGLLVEEVNSTSLQMVVRKYKYITKKSTASGGEGPDETGSSGYVGIGSGGCYVKEELSAEEAYASCFDEDGGGTYAQVSNDENSLDTAEDNALFFDVKSKLSTAEMGPISGASVYLSDAKSGNVVYETSTSGGSSSASAGILQLPQEMLNGLDEASYYLITVSGGVDIDSNDDGYVDDVFTKKRGDLHALIKGDFIKRKHVKVNILSEVVYQVNKALVKNENDTALIDARLDATAQRLLISYDTAKTYADVLKWMPRYDKRKLRKNYMTHYEPMAQKIYRGEDVYSAAYDIVNKPSLLNYVLIVSEKSTLEHRLVTIDAGIDTQNIEYMLTGAGSELFTVNTAGEVYFTEDASIDYETQNQYNLTLTVISGIYTEESNVTLLVKNVLDAPEAASLQVSVSDTVKSGTLVGQLELRSPIDAPILSVALDDNSTFSIDSNGSIRLRKPITLDYFARSGYKLTAFAGNRYGESLPMDINISVFTTLSVNSKTFSLMDHQEGGIKIGKLQVAANGNQINSIVLDGVGSEDFNISEDGDIYLVYDTKLDAEKQDVYDLDVLVNDETLAHVQILVKNRIIATLDTLDNAVSLSVDNNRSLLYVADNNYYGAALIDFSEKDTLYFESRTSGEDGSVSVVGYDGLHTFMEGSYGKVEFFDVSAEQGLVSSSVYTVSGMPRFLRILSKNSLVAVGLYDHIDLLKREDNGSVRSVKKLYFRRSHDIVVTADEKYMFVPRYDNSVLILDITNILQAKQVGTLSNLTHVCMDIIDQRFIAIAGVNEADEHVVEIYDMTDLISTALVSTIILETDTEIKTLVHDSTHLYTGSDVLNVIDMTDVTAPRLVETIDIPGGVEDAVVLEDREQMIIASGTSGVHLVSLEGFAPYVGVSGVLVFDKTVERDAAIGSIVGQVDLVYSGSGVVNYAIVGEAADFFTIDTSGIVHVASSLAGSPEEYVFQIAATNSVGTRLTDARIYVHSIPVLADFNGSINSMSPSGTVVGFVDLGSDDAASIETISLSGEGSAYFSVEPNGKIIFTGGVELHHFITPNYLLNIQASNRFGASDVTQIMINVTPVVSSIQLFEDTSKYISQIKPSADGSYIEVEIYKYYEDIPQYISRINIDNVLLPSLESITVINELSQKRQFGTNTTEIMFDDDNKTILFDRGEMGEGLVIKDSQANNLAHYDVSSVFSIYHMTLMANNNILLHAGNKGLGTLDITPDRQQVISRELILTGEVNTFVPLANTPYLLIGRKNKLQILDLFGM